MSGVVRSRLPVIVICSFLAAVAMDAVGGQSSNQDSIKLGCVGGEVLLSHNQTLVSPESVQASSSLTRAPPSKVYDSVSTWCAPNTSNANPYIDMEFTEPLLISMMLTTGSTIVGTKVGIYYVTNFTLEYSSPNNASNLNYYTESEETDSKKYFEASGFTTLIQFERPILTRRIRLTTIKWFDSDGDRFSVQFICQGVSLYGCLASEVTEQGAATAAVIIDSKPLAIALPITLITIITLLLFLVLLIAYVCIKRSAGAKKSAATPESGYSHLDRSIQSISMTSLRFEGQSMNNQKEEADAVTEAGYPNLESRKSSVIKKVDNPIYGKERPTHKDGQVSVYPPIGESTDYEPINPNEAQDPQNSSRVGQNIYNDIPEDNDINEDDMTSKKLNYESVQLDEQATVFRAAPLNLDVSPRDSMIDNTAYSMVTYDSPNRPVGVHAQPKAKATEEHIQYEEVVALQSNASYEYVKMAAAGLVGED